LPVIALLNSCDDIIVNSGIAHVAGTPSICTSQAGVCEPGLLNDDIGNKAYGYVEIDFSLSSPLPTASADYSAIILRGQNGSAPKFYSCMIEAQLSGSTSMIEGVITGINPAILPGATFAGAKAFSTQLTSSFLGTHTLGCELVLVGANPTINEYLDGTLLTSYILGQNSADNGPLKTGTGKVGFWASSTTPSTDNMHILDFRYYSAKP
jgi:hypothetical protein